MSTTTTLTAAPRSDALKTILLAALVAGALDLLYAIVVWLFRGVPPIRIMQSIAGGVLGSDAFTGGVPTALLGTLLHFFIMTGAAALFYFVATRFSLLTRKPILAAVVFGIGMYIAMVYVIVPLSASPGGGNRSLGWNTLIAFFPHVVLVGLPFAYITRRALLGSARANP